MAQILQRLRRMLGHRHEGYTQGIELYNRGRYDEALELFDLVTDEGGGSNSLDSKLAHFYSGQAHCNIGILAFHTGKTDKAIDHLLSAVEHNPNLHGAYYYLGIALNNEGRYEDAMEVFNRVLDVNPTCLPVRRKLAVVFYNESRFSDAQNELEKTVRLHPLWADMRYHLGLIKASSGRLAEGLHEINAALDINPHYLKARIAAGLLLAQMDRIEEGVAALSAILDDHPDFPDIHHYLGLLLARTGDFETALVHLGISLDIRPTYLRAKLGYALVLGALGRDDDARHQLNELVEMDPDYIEAAPIAEHLTRLDEASGPETWQQFLDEFAEQARANLPQRIQIIPDFSDIASLFSPTKDKALFQSLIDVYESSAEADHGYADVYHNLGQLYTQLDIHDKAISNYRRAVEINPHFVRARINLYRDLLEVNMLTEAEEQTSILLEQGVDFPDLHLDRGRILVELNRLDQASLELGRAMELNPRLADAYWLASLLAERQGDLERAVAVLETYPDLESGRPEGDTFRRRMERLKG